MLEPIHLITKGWLSPSNLDESAENYVELKKIEKMTYCMIVYLQVVEVIKLYKLRENEWL